jgi:hypothetical protein
MNPSNQKPKFSAVIIAERFRTAVRWTAEAFDFARELDWLGDANQHPEGSEQRELALVRDGVDHQLNRCCREIEFFRRGRADSTRFPDLLIDVVHQQMGDGSDALHLMQRYHALFGDGTEPNGDVGSETLPDCFAWDTYLRVCDLAKLAEHFPKHIRHSARDMHGWPMIVSHHLDITPEFQRLAELLELGADYPLAVGPRKRRGTETPLLSYLDPLVWRLNTLRTILIDTEKTHAHEDFTIRLTPFWWEHGEEPPSTEMLAILKLVPALPPLTQKTAAEWSRKVIVPMPPSALN